MFFVLCSLIDCLPSLAALKRIKKEQQHNALTTTTPRLYITYLALVLSFSARGVSPGSTTLSFKTLFSLLALATLLETLLLKYYMPTYLDTYLSLTQQSLHTYYQHLNALILSCSSQTWLNSQFLLNRTSTMHTQENKTAMPPSSQTYVFPPTTLVSFLSRLALGGFYQILTIVS